MNHMFIENTVIVKHHFLIYIILLHASCENQFIGGNRVDKLQST